MFWTSMMGFPSMRMPASLIWPATMSMASPTWSMLFAPVQTTFPLRKSRVAVLGSFRR